MNPETIMMISDAIDGASAMFLTVAFALLLATAAGVLSGLFLMLAAVRLWNWFTVGSWNSAIRSAARKVFE